MTHDEFKARTYFYIFSNAPRRSGKLQANIKIQDTPVGFDIIIDISYMVYTEEHWISPRWRGRENPNLKWLKRTVERLAQEYASQIGGKVYVE
jgi:outer membrane protein assembly factor BamE (lipoprotein component of BamABCDE complex)